MRSSWVLLLYTTGMAVQGLHGGPTIQFSVDVEQSFLVKVSSEHLAVIETRKVPRCTSYPTDVCASKSCLGQERESHQSFSRWESGASICAAHRPVSGLKDLSSLILPTCTLDHDVL